MENNKSLLEDLYKRIDDYARNTIELYKLKTIRQFTEVSSSLTVRLFVFSLLSLFVFMLSVGGALWIGELLGKVYYGFFIIAGAYLLAGIFLRFVFRKATKRWVSNVLIKHITK